MLKIRVLNISKKDLHKTLKKFKGTAWDQSPIFKKIYEEEYGQFGGEPYGCLVGDYHFDHSPPDVELLGEMSKVAPRRHAPFITGANPTLFQMDSWQELSNPRDLTKIFQTPEYAAWRSLRESEDSKYVGPGNAALPGPPALRRQDDPVEEFAFEEDTEGADHAEATLGQRGLRHGREHQPVVQEYGWCTRIRGVESGGAVELPTHTFPTDDGGVDMKCPTEIAIRPARGGAGQERLMPLSPPQEHRHRRLHRRAVAAQAGGIRRCGRHRQRQPGGAAALPLRDAASRIT